MSRHDAPRSASGSLGLPPASENMAQLPSEAAGSIVLPTPTPADAATTMETPSVELRPFVMTDSAVLHRMGNTPAVHRHLKYARFPQPYSEEHARHWLAETGIPAGSAAQLPIYLAISDPDTHECMGCAALEPKPDLEVFTAEIAYWLDEPYWGKKVITRVVHTLTGLAFAALPALNRIEAGILSTNVASCKALERCGFTREGVMRRAYVKDGAVCDKIMYGLLREERAALPPATHITVDGVTWVERPLTSSACTAVSPQTGRLAPGNDAHAAVGGSASSGCAVSAPAAASAFE